MVQYVSKTQPMEPHSDGVPPEETAFSITLQPNGGLDWDEYKRLFVTGDGGATPNLDQVLAEGNTSTHGIAITATTDTPFAVAVNTTSREEPVEPYDFQGDVIAVVDADSKHNFGVDRFGSMVYRQGTANRYFRVGGTEATPGDPNANIQVRDMADPAAAQYGGPDGIRLTSAAGRLRCYKVTGSGGSRITDIIQLAPSTDTDNALALGGDFGLKVKKAAAQADSTATTIAGLVTDFNALLAKLRAAGLMAS